RAAARRPAQSDMPLLLLTLLRHPAQRAVPPAAHYALAVSFPDPCKTIPELLQLNPPRGAPPPVPTGTSACCQSGSPALYLHASIAVFPRSLCASARCRSRGIGPAPVDDRREAKFASQNHLDEWAHSPMYPWTRGVRLFQPNWRSRELRPAPLHKSNLPRSATARALPRSRLLCGLRGDAAIVST